MHFWCPVSESYIIGLLNLDSTTKRLPATKAFHPSSLMDKGIFGLGSVDMDRSALQWIMDRNGPSPTTRPVCVCGSAMECVVAVGSLIREGCDAERITLLIKEENLDHIAQSTVSGVRLSLIH
jgi:hypothetical protein